jgi:beta-glucosidase
MLSVAVALLATATCMWAQPTEDERVEELLQKMTLQEKIGQLNQLSVGGFDHNAAGMMRAGMVGSILNECNPNVLNRYQRAAVEDSRLGIPLLISRDVIHGFKTMFPIPLGLAATFDPELVQQGARFAAIEATANGVRWTFSPMLDIARDPRWGRIAEGSGEDTYLDTQMGVAMVKGYQGDTFDQTSMAACVKHFVAYGAAEGGRDYNSTGVSERTLRNVYLPPFEACVEAGVMTLMTSFNDNDGIPSTGNGFLVNDVLRGEWGFKGFVVSDWASIREMVNHGYAEDNKHAGELAFNAGVDMDMMSFSYISHLEELINEGKVSMETVDNAVRSILRVKFRLGLFENPYIDEPNVEAAFYSEEALEAARKSAVESAVLLTNNGVLPLNRSKVKTVLVTGPMADAPHDQLGTWTFDGDPAHTVTPLAAIRELYGEDVNVIYEPGLTYSREFDKGGIAKAVKAAKKADVILAFMGEEAILSGEAHSLVDITLKGDQRRLLEALHETGKPVVLVLENGRAVDLSVEDKVCEAILIAWFGGETGAKAIAETLVGLNNPAGRLPVSLPQDSYRIPCYYTVLPNNTEVMFEGSRRPRYEFGFGLSYTEFEYSNLKIDKQGELDYIVSVDIKNIGKVKGDEVVELYINDKVSSIITPLKELKGFERITLEAGETKTVSFKLDFDSFKLLNRHYEWVVENGEFEILVGASSNDIKLKETIEIDIK